MAAAFGLALTLSASSACAGFDPFADDRARPRFAIDGPDGLRLVLKGAAELSWLDIEGAGGEGRDSTTDTRSLGTRSPYLRLDRVRLAPRLQTPDGLALLTELRFSPESAHARAAWLDGRWHPSETLCIHAELGFARPFVSVDPQTRRASLAQRIWWDRAEAHAVVEAAWQGQGWGIDGGISVAQVRPLASAPVNDASPGGTIALLIHDAARPISGGQTIYGARLATRYAGLRVEAFGFVGRLAPDGGTDTLRNQIEGFRELPGFNIQDPRQQDSTLWWAGGRVDWRVGAVRARAEYVTARESLLRRTTALLQTGVDVTLRPGSWLPAGALILRGEIYRLHNAAALRVRSVSQAVSWDWTVLTLASRLRVYRRVLWLRVEHSLLREGRGGPRFDNDETTAQLELRF